MGTRDKRPRFAYLTAWFLTISAIPFCSAQSPSESPQNNSSGVLPNIVVKGSEKESPSLVKPPLDIPIDPYAAIRESLKPNGNLLLIPSPNISPWSRALPEIIHRSRLIQPWNDFLKSLPSIDIPVRDDLSAAISQSNAGKKAKGWSWRLDIINEQGESVQSFSGHGIAPETMTWDGRENSGKWIGAGRSYSILYHWSNGARTITAMGRTIEFPGVVHPAQDGSVVSLDFASLFGAAGQDDQISDAGKPLLRAAADWFNRYDYGSTISIEVRGGDNGQAQAIASFLASVVAIDPNQIPAKSPPSSDSSRSVIIKFGGR
ncbi:MAG: hypothetical protein ACYCPQ_05105 [Elusimicrobiota bacterium]